MKCPQEFCPGITCLTFNDTLYLVERHTVKIGAHRHDAELIALSTAEILFGWALSTPLSQRPVSPEGKEPKKKK